MVRRRRTSFTSSLSCVIMHLCFPAAVFVVACLAIAVAPPVLPHRVILRRSPQCIGRSQPRGCRFKEHSDQASISPLGRTNCVEHRARSSRTGATAKAAHHWVEVLDGHPRRSLWPGGDSLTPFASSRAHLWTLPLLRVSTNYCAGRRASCTRRDRGRARRTSARR